MNKNKKITFGQVRDIPTNVEETRLIRFILSTTTRDRHHTVLNQNGWELESYRKNPIVGYMHNLYGDMCNPPNPDDVIAKTVKIGDEEMSMQGPVVLAASAEFEPANLNLAGDKIFRKLLFGTLSGASVGFIEMGAGAWGVNKEAEGGENEIYYFKGQELLEWSVVNIPSNPDGAKRAMRDSTAAAISYAHRSLGGKFRFSQIENMRVRDVLDLLDGKDIEIRETDPDKVRKMIMEEMAQKDINDLIEKQQITLKRNLLKN